MSNELCNRSVNYELHDVIYMNFLLICNINKAF